MGFSKTESVESLMPKGVEHKVEKNIGLVESCVESLMPKGVEHLAFMEALCLKLCVSNL